MSDTLTTLPVETHIGLVHLKVSSLAGALEFYNELLGFHLAAQEGASATLSSGDNSPTVLRLSEIPDARRKPPRTSGLYHVAIRLPSRPALGALLGRLIEAGYPLQGAADHLVSEAIYLADPDGIGLELYIDRPRDEWPRLDGQVKMATDPLDAASLLEEGKVYGRDWQGIAPGTDIGHVHLQIADLDAAESFYCDRLGFSVTQRNYPGALFVSAGGYHHHIGLNIWAGRNVPPPPADVVGLQSFQVLIPDGATRTALSERLDEYQIPAPEGAEKGDDLWIQDPDGIKIQLSWI